MHVAVVGGGAAFAELVKLELEEAGFVLSPVERAHVALVAGRTRDKDADALVAAVHALRANLPVVLLTGSREAERRGYAHGADLVLQKPFEFTELVAILRRLGRRRTRTTSRSRSLARTRTP